MLRPGAPAACIAAGQGAAGASRWSGWRSGGMVGAGAESVGRRHGRQPGHAGVPAAGGGVQPGRLSREGFGPVRRRTRMGDRVVRPAHEPGQRPAAPRAQRDLEPGAARGPARVLPGRPATPGAPWTGPRCTRRNPPPGPSPSGLSPNTFPIGSVYRRSRVPTGMDER